MQQLGTKSNQKEEKIKMDKIGYVTIIVHLFTTFFFYESERTGCASSCMDGMFE